MFLRERNSGTISSLRQRTTNLISLCGSIRLKNSVHKETSVFLYADSGLIRICAAIGQAGNTCERMKSRAHASSSGGQDNLGSECCELCELRKSSNGV